MESNQKEQEPIMDYSGIIEVNDDIMLARMDDFHSFQHESSIIKGKRELYTAFLTAMRGGDLEEKYTSLGYFKDWPVQGVIVASGVDGYEVGDRVYVRVFGGTMINIKGDVLRQLNKNDVIVKDVSKDK